MINFTLDGISHVNIYSRGSTELGRMMSNFTRFPIETPEGQFMSVEGYWFYLGLEVCSERETLKSLYGYNAKKVGTELKKTLKTKHEPDFENKIKNAIYYKFKRNAHMLTHENMHLPFEHYYNFNSKIVDVKQKYIWMIDAIADMRQCILENYDYTLV